MIVCVCVVGPAVGEPFLSASSFPHSTGSWALACLPYRTLNTIRTAGFEEMLAHLRRTTRCTWRSPMGLSSMRTCSSSTTSVIVPSIRWMRR